MNSSLQFQPLIGLLIRDSWCYACAIEDAVGNLTLSNPHPVFLLLVLPSYAPFSSIFRSSQLNFQSNGVFRYLVLRPEPMVY